MNVSVLRSPVRARVRLNDSSISVVAEHPPPSQFNLVLTVGYDKAEYSDYSAGYNTNLHMGALEPNTIVLDGEEHVIATLASVQSMWSGGLVGEVFGFKDDVKLKYNKIQYTVKELNKTFDLIWSDYYRYYMHGQDGPDLLFTDDDKDKTFHISLEFMDPTE